MIRGQERAVEAFLAAWAGRRLHHGWLLAGPRGVGKASFALAAARRVLADASDAASGKPRADDGADDARGVAVSPDHPMVRLIEAGSHPDLRWLERLEKDKGGLARNISVDQVRSLHGLFAVTPSMSDWRVVVIDSADDLEPAAANALLKMLEEPPPATLFFLVSHAPGRLLPTIRSRCRRLDFQPLGDDVMASILAEALPDVAPAARSAALALGGGSAGRAIEAARHDLAALAAEARAILDHGDPDNQRRARLASALALKSAADRYAAFLALVPTLIADAAPAMTGERRARALDAYAKARELAALAPRLTLDPAASVYQLATLLASAAPGRTGHRHA